MKYEKSHRPWGWHQIKLQKKGKAWVKVVFVKRGARLSLQSHEERVEIWIVLKGKIETLVGDKKQTLGLGGIQKIGKQEKHRMMGIKDSYVMELAFGNPTEEDIVRYEDDYGRAD
jgi:mannose-1-phosphate guanylyltransferase/mannose-6-phosphate isomerase